MKKIGILTSGGDSPGMNAAIRAVVRSAIYYGIKPYGVNSGYEGLIDGDIEELKIWSVSDILQKGGTMLKTSRSDRFRTPEGLQAAYEVIKSMEIEALVVIGGDGSLKGAFDLSKLGIPVMGLPGTIDNDLGYTDFTIGFDTAVNTVLGAISNIRDTSSSHERTVIIEVMGRDCGDIALHAGLAGGAEYILIPEREVKIDEMCLKVVQGRNRGKSHSIIIKAEGIEIPTQKLADIIKERTGLETKIVVLAYLQRGGSPTARDRFIASKMGHKAVELLKDGVINRAIGISGTQIVDYDIADALKMKRIYEEDIVKLADILSI